MMGQGDLFPRMAEEQSRRRHLDSAVYEVILTLRKKGVSVYSAGEDHLVDGALLSSVQLLEFGRHFCGKK